MGWLGPEGVAPVTGSRWSAGAFWADASDPKPTDSVWEDEDDWPHTDSPLTLNVFVGGWPVHEWVQSASWRLGQDDIWAGPTPGSASIALAGESLPAVEPADRVVITTEDDVLWAGRVVVPVLTTEPGKLTATLALSCADELTKAAGPDRAVTVHVRAALEQLRWAAARAGIGAVVTLLQPLPDDEIAPVFGGDRPLDASGMIVGGVDVSGTDLAVLSMVADAVNAAVAWTPGGLRAWKRTMTIAAGAYPDVGADVRRITTSADPTRVINEWTAPAGTQFLDAASIEAHGLRARAAPGVEWYAGVTQTVHYWGRLMGIPDPVDNAAPPREMRTGRPARLVELEWPAIDEPPAFLPFDAIAVGADTVLLTTIAHAVTVAEWTAAASGLVLEQEAP